MFMRKAMTCLLGGLLVLWSATAYADKIKDVNVVNTPDITVTNMPDVSITSLPDVNVANMPDIHVANDSTSPIPVTVYDAGQTIVEWRYIGITRYADNGGFEFEGAWGVTAMHKVCAKEFGPSARAATITEAYFRPAPDENTRDGWLVPGAQSSITIEAAGIQYSYPYDAASGEVVGDERDTAAETMARAHCQKYTIEVGSGPVTRPNGTMRVRSCRAVLPVACSAPVAIFVSP